jgi:hypothetical protein
MRLLFLDGVLDSFALMAIDGVRAQAKADWCKNKLTSATSIHRPLYYYAT